MNSYIEFISKKKISFSEYGFTADLSASKLFDWQKIAVDWALKKGRAALFEDCGLGKTPQQLEWANQVHKHTGKDVLILAPLAVSLQTEREGRKFDIKVNICNEQDDVKPGINITNYEKLHKFYPDHFSGIVLDESSILKNFAGKLRNQIIDAFRSTPYKLCCTATPAPNDFTELGNTAEFLGVMTRTEMLSMFFINDAGDTGTWRLKGHVKDNRFWEWLCTWALTIKSPSNIGFKDEGYILPPIKYENHIIPYTGKIRTLFVEAAESLDEIRKSMHETLNERVERVAEIINRSNETWVAWCNFNEESSMLAKKIKDAVEVKGSDPSEHKEGSMIRFADNQIKCLVTKPKIAMFGMNWQNCHNTAITGLSHSYEQFYQLVRRFWRFGQVNPVNVHIVLGEREINVVNAIRTKEENATAMHINMNKRIADIMQKEIHKTSRRNTAYNPVIDMRLPSFLKEAA